eukprot:TRINITY_DN1925_c0_g1_i2.p1 TRINITY_DN1925_c0_g1~~TRINITY_DN1925_c0_g1_i2.p1  ORF type:complete len:452 (-),score=99.67 TRINITY_DN1925_c0_g1_i2:63-1418(-)
MDKNTTMKGGEEVEVETSKTDELSNFPPKCQDEQIAQIEACVAKHGLQNDAQTSILCLLLKFSTNFAYDHINSCQNKQHHHHHCHADLAADLSTLFREMEKQKKEEEKIVDDVEKQMLFTQKMVIQCNLHSNKLTNYLSDNCNIINQLDFTATKTTKTVMMMMMLPYGADYDTILEETEEDVGYTIEQIYKDADEVHQFSIRIKKIATDQQTLIHDLKVKLAEKQRMVENRLNFQRSKMMATSAQEVTSFLGSSPITIFPGMTITQLLKTPLVQTAVALLGLNHPRHHHHHHHLNDHHNKLCSEVLLKVVITMLIEAIAEMFSTVTSNDFSLLKRIETALDKLDEANKQMLHLSIHSFHSSENLLNISENISLSLTGDRSNIIKVADACEEAIQTTLLSLHAFSNFSVDWSTSEVSSTTTSSTTSSTSSCALSPALSRRSVTNATAIRACE